MAVYKVINLDSPIESDYWVDIPVRDPATNKDAVDEEGRILVERHVTRSVKNEEMSTINAAVETVNTLKEDYSTFKEEVSTKVNNHDSSILTNTNSITTLTDSVTNHDLQINALYTKINAIQGIDIDDFKYVTETDIKNIKENYLPLAGGTITGDLVLRGKVSSNSPIKANLQGTADRAIGDINGKALTSYIANLKVSGASVTITNGAGEASNYIVDNINHATHANSATNATHATSADSATKATNDSSNRNIVNTYALKGNYPDRIKFAWDTTFKGYVNVTVDKTTWGLITSQNISSQSVKHATTADSATNANHATKADSATTATNANHATSADSATRATCDANNNNIQATYINKNNNSSVSGILNFTKGIQVQGYLITIG